MNNNSSRKLTIQFHSGNELVKAIDILKQDSYLTPTGITILCLGNKISVDIKRYKLLLKNDVKFEVVDSN